MKKFVVVKYEFILMTFEGTYVNSGSIVECNEVFRVRGILTHLYILSIGVTRLFLEAGCKIPFS